MVRAGRYRVAGSHVLPPLAGLLALQLGQQPPQGFARITDKVDLKGVSQTHHGRIDVDLCRARLAELGQELCIRKAGPDHQQRVAVTHQLVRGTRAEQADRAGDIRQIVGEDVVGEQCLSSGPELRRRLSEPVNWLPTAWAPRGSAGLAVSGRRGGGRGRLRMPDALSQYSTPPPLETCRKPQPIPRGYRRRSTGPQFDRGVSGHEVEDPP